MDTETLQWVTLFSTLVFGVAASAFAYLQALSNRNQLRIAKFDRAMKVYSAASELLWHASLHQNMPSEVLREFREGTHMARFLFSKEITDFLKRIEEQAESLAACCFEYDLPVEERPDGYDQSTLRKRKIEAAAWLMAQNMEIETLFRRHIRVAG